MKCPICEEDVSACCICGYCLKCIEKYGHEKCSEIVKKDLHPEYPESEDEWDEART